MFEISYIIVIEYTRATDKIQIYKKVAREQKIPMALASLATYPFLYRKTVFAIVVQKVYFPYSFCNTSVGEKCLSFWKGSVCFAICFFSQICVLNKR
jgi:hypothetical protein